MQVLSSAGSDGSVYGAREVVDPEVRKGEIGDSVRRRNLKVVWVLR